MSKVTYNLLLGKTKKKDKQTSKELNENVVKQNKFIYFRTLRSQTLANIIQIFQNIYHVDLHYT